MSKKRICPPDRCSVIARLLELTLLIGFNTVVKPNNSIYLVFGNLPELIRIHDRPPVAKKDGMSPASHEMERSAAFNENHVFQDAMKDVKMIDRNRRRIHRPILRDRLTARSAQHDVTMLDVLAEDYAVTVRHLPEYMEGYADGLNPTIMEKLRNEEFSVQEVLDLHGLSSFEAAEMFSDFLDRVIHNGICCIKVIHGRGLRSKNGPVLKESLKGWLVRAIHRKWVVAFCSAKMSHGGPGATLILLRVRPRKERLNIVG
jgi:DNA-nicking Smr family endonuclease